MSACGEEQRCVIFNVNEELFDSNDDPEKMPENLSPLLVVIVAFKPYQTERISERTTREGCSENRLRERRDGLTMQAARRKVRRSLACISGVFDSLFDDGDAIGLGEIVDFR